MKGLQVKKVPGALESTDVPWSHTYFALQQGNAGFKAFPSFKSFHGNMPHTEST